MKITEWKESEVKENMELLNEYATKSEKWRRNAFLMEGARYGQHNSQAEYEQMMIMRIAPLALSISTAICDSAEALFLQNKPAPKVAPLIYPYDTVKQEQSNQVAGLFEFLINKDFQESFGNLQIDRILRDQSNTGHGIGQVIPVFENGEFFTQFNRLPWRFYFPDPSSMGDFYEDSESQIYAFPMSPKSAHRYLRKKIFDLSEKDFEEYFKKGSFADKMSLFFTDDKYLLGGNRKDVLFVNRMTLEEETIYKALPAKIPDGLEAEKLASLTSRTHLELSEELRLAEKSGLIKIEKKTGMMLAHHISVGNLGIKEVFPLTEYTTVPLKYDSRDNAFPYGRMWYIYSPQRAINKFFMSALLNMSLLNSTKILAEEDSIINENHWVTSASTPGAIIKYRLPIPGISKPPEIVKATPLDQNWLVLPKFLVYIMEYVSGMFGVMQGNPEKAPDTFSTIASMQATGGAKIKRRQNDIDAFLGRVGKIQAQMYQHYAPPMGFGSTINKEGETEVKKYNEIYLEEYTDKANQKKMRAGIKPETDLSFGIKNVVYTSKASAGYETATQSLALTTLATQLSVPELVPDILKMMNLPGVADTIEKIERRNDLSGQVEQQGKVIKELEQKTKIYQNQIFSLATAIEQARAQGKGALEVEKLRNIVNQIEEGAQNA